MISIFINFNQRGKNKKEQFGILQGYVLDGYFYVLIMHENWLNFVNPCKKKKRNSEKFLSLISK